jgi:hypothetical protein
VVPLHLPVAGGPGRPEHWASGFSGPVKVARSGRWPRGTLTKFFKDWQQSNTSAKESADYTSHYNRERNQCLIEVGTLHLYPQGGTLNRDEIYDAVERTLIVHRSEVSGVPNVKFHIDLASDSGFLPDTPEEEEWIHDLMKK